MRLLLLALLFLVTSCSLYSRRTEPGPKHLRVLMIGNSYTGQTLHELRPLLESDPDFRVELVAHHPGGRSLADHTRNKRVARLIEGGEKWDVIVLQDHSRVPALAMAGRKAERDAFEAGGPKLIERLAAHQPQARLIFFETWARHPDLCYDDALTHFDGDPAAMQESIAGGYRDLRDRAKEQDAFEDMTIAPVGRTYASWHQPHGYADDALRLHESDGSHPNRAGELLSALVLYHEITGRLPDEERVPKLTRTAGERHFGHLLLEHARQDLSAGP